MTTLPPEIIKKVMKEYHSHPVADLLRAQVTFFPNLIPDDQDVICIGTHDGNNMYAPYHWSTKECECFNASMAIEETVIMNKLIDVILKTSMRYILVSPDDAIISAIRKLDATYFHCNRHMLIFIASIRKEELMERLRKRLPTSDWDDGSFVSSTVYSPASSDDD